MTQIVKDSSQYRGTPIKNWYLDIMVPRFIPKNDTDEIIKISPKFNQRPDLLSQDIYGTPRLWWIFAMRNPNSLIDPINDFVAGLEIFIPQNILKN